MRCGRKEYMRVLVRRDDNDVERLMDCGYMEVNEKSNELIFSPQGYFDFKVVFENDISLREIVKELYTNGYADLRSLYWTRL